MNLAQNMGWLQCFQGCRNVCLRQLCAAFILTPYNFHYKTQLAIVEYHWRLCFHVGAQGNASIHICKCSPIEKCPKQSPVPLIMPTVIDNIHMDTIPVSQDKTIGTNTHDKVTIQDFTILLAHIGVPVLHFSEF